jgi:hypothetical protein
VQLILNIELTAGFRRPPDRKGSHVKQRLYRCLSWSWPDSPIKALQSLPGLPSRMMRKTYFAWVASQTGIAYISSTEERRSPAKANELDLQRLHHIFHTVSSMILWALLMPIFSICSQSFATSVGHNKCADRRDLLHAGKVVQTVPIGQLLHRRVEILRRRAMLPCCLFQHS